jgi:hypothetical protein
MPDSILIEMTRGLMRFRTVIAPTEPTETAFQQLVPSCSWVVLSIRFSNDSSTLTVNFTYPESGC